MFESAVWRIALPLMVLLGFGSTSGAGVGGVPVRDLVMVAGARDNQLVGYGLVVGLAGDGDKDPVYTCLLYTSDAADE